MILLLLKDPMQNFTMLHSMLIPFMMSLKQRIFYPCMKFHLMLHLHDTEFQEDKRFISLIHLETVTKHLQADIWLMRICQRLLGQRRKSGRVFSTTEENYLSHL